MKMFLSDADVTNHIYIVHSGVINAATVSERRRMIMDTEVETLPSKSLGRKDMLRRSIACA